MPKGRRTTTIKRAEVQRNSSKNVDRLNSVESFHPHLPDGGLIRSLYFFKIEEVICAEVFITNQRN